jgi:hypothetical protein
MIERISRDTTKSDFFFPHHATLPTLQRVPSARSGSGNSEEKAGPCAHSPLQTKRVPIREIHPTPALLPRGVQRAHACEHTRGRCLLVVVAPSEESSLRSESGLGQLVSVPRRRRLIFLLCGCLPVGRGAKAMAESGVGQLVSVPGESGDVVQCVCCAGAFPSVVAPSDGRICMKKH